MAYHRKKVGLTIKKILIIPDHLPKIKRVVDVNLTPNVIKTTILSKGKMVISGCIEVFLMYAGVDDCSAQSVQCCDFAIPYTFFVKHCYAKAGSESRISSTIEYQDTRITNERTISIFIMANIQKGCKHKKCRQVVNTPRGIDKTSFI